MLTLISKGVPTKLLKFFWLKIFFICHRCQRHRWWTLSCEYLRKFSKKFEMTLMVYSGAWEKLIHLKNQRSKISCHFPFKSMLSYEHALTIFSVAYGGASSLEQKFSRLTLAAENWNYLSNAEAGSVIRTSFHLSANLSRVRICKPFKEPRNRKPTWWNRFLGIDYWAY